MTVDQARKILGSSGEEYTDLMIVDFIETAEIFKNIFFEFVQKDNTSKLWHNGVNNNDKTKVGSLCTRI